MLARQRSRTRFCLAAALILGRNLSLAAIPSSPHYRLPWLSISSGDTVHSSSYQATVSLQALASQKARSPSYQLHSGFLSPPDSDGDRVRDFLDNCLLIANPDQRNSNAGNGPGQDRFGNLCDADINNDGRTNTLDFGLFKRSFGQTAAGLDADINGDGRVNTLDFGLFKRMFGNPPGPSGTLP